MAPETAPEGAQGGYCIEIAVKPDGTFTVSREDAKQEAAEMPGQEPAGQSANNIGDALKLALDIFQKEGGQAGEDDFDAGFQGGKPGEEM